MIQRRIHTIDVFTSVPFKGNPVAVILDSEGLDSAQMQAIANWTNLSETTFVTPPRNGEGDHPHDGGGAGAGKPVAADYHLRIFTPRAELPFAGHPTIGSAHAILAAGIAAPRNGKLVQQCGVGLVDIAVPDDWRESGVSFRLPAHRSVPAPDADALHRALGAPAPFVHAPAIVDVGPRWAIAHYPDEATVRALTPDYAALAAYDRTHKTTGLTVFAETGAGGIVTRSFAPADGINEDPVCGSGNGAVAAYRLDHGAAHLGDRYTASQGREVGRDGHVRITYAADGIHVGGCALICVEGVIVA
jgi:PhzF family phenazine biosynthesis protein